MNATTLGMFLFFAPLQAAHVADPWPSVPIPASVSTYQIAQDFQANGVPMRLQGFISRLPAAETLAAFRRSIDRNMVETDGADGKILGTAYGRHYLTVQVKGLGQQAHGVIALVPLSQPSSVSEAAHRSIQAGLNRLPPGSRLISHTIANQRDARYVTLIVTNRSSVSYNEERVTLLLKDLGMEPHAKSQGNPARSVERVMWFRGRGKEGNVAIRAADDGASVLVISIVDQTTGGQ
jgi:hypothetical protein